MIPVKILFFSDYDFDADYDDSCVNDHEDCEIDDDIDVDSVGEVGVEDNLGLNPQETLSLKHRGLQIIRCNAVQCSVLQCNMQYSYCTLYGQHSAVNYKISSTNRVKPFGL